MKNESVLHALYYGNLNLSQRSYRKNSEYAKELHLVVEKEQALQSFFDALPEGEAPRRQLEELLQAQADLHCLSTYEDFPAGFHLGAAIMLETFVAPQKSMLEGVI